MSIFSLYYYSVSLIFLRSHVQTWPLCPLPVHASVVSRVCLLGFLLFIWLSSKSRKNVRVIVLRVLVRFRSTEGICRFFTIIMHGILYRDLDVKCENIGTHYGRSGFRTASSNLYISVFCCKDDLCYQRWLVPLSVNWQHNANVSTIPNVSFHVFMSIVVNSGGLGKLRYWARKHHFQSRLRMPHDLLVVWHNVYKFSMVQADRGALYPLLPSW